MDVISMIVVIFSCLAAADRIFGSRLGLGKEFERGFMLLGNMALSMIGMIIISPWIAQLLSPAFELFYNAFGIDPSTIPASLFANDMGGAPLSVEVAKDAGVGLYNALVVSSMMGVTISFTVPYALGVVKKEKHREMFLGLLCGVVTVPVGCFVGGLICGVGIGTLLLNLLPIILLSAVIAVGLLLAPNLCVKIFSVFGLLIKALITVGLVLGILKFLTGLEPIAGLAPLEEGAAVCLNAAVVMTGMFPLIYIVSRLIKKPLVKIGKAAGISDTSAMGFVSSLATSMTTFEMMNEMEEKGVMLNSAFAVSAAFTFAGHLAFTMAFPGSNGVYIGAMIAGKLVGGISALIVAALLYGRIYGKTGGDNNKEKADGVEIISEKE